MAGASAAGRLEKGLTLPYVYAIATGVTLSSGFFLLPGLAFAESGPAIPLAYILAALPLVPGIFAKAELATAMPRAGGDYFFLDRAVGPMWGTVAGLGVWLALVLKTAFALVGMGAYLKIFVPDAPLAAVAVAVAVMLGILNWIGVGKTGAVQVALVIAILVILAWFAGDGFTHMEVGRFDGFLAAGWDSIWATAGLVCVSYLGLTKIASVAEEIRDPERTIPLAMFLALGTAILVYAVGTMVMVGVLPAEVLSGTLTPAAATAFVLAGTWGRFALAVAAVLAFTSVANAGILSASRYPLAMSRDRLVPHVFKRIGTRRTPTMAIAVTVATILVCVVVFDPTRIAKLASAFQLLLFASNCLAVLVMRGSRIDSYDPGYRSPFYPWLHLVGLVAPLWLIAQIGGLAVVFCLGLGVLGVSWYYAYGRRRTFRTGAIYHVFERWAQHRDEGIDPELRVIMKEKGLREEDPYEEVVARSFVLDRDRKVSFESLVDEAARYLEVRTGVEAEHLRLEFLEGTRVGATPVERGVALPHLRLTELLEPVMVMVRTTEGIAADDAGVWGEHVPHDPIFAIFFLISPEENAAQHLRLLAHVAGRVEDDDFMHEWLSAADEHELKEVMLREERFLNLRLRADGAGAALIGHAVRDLELPAGCLIAVVHRGAHQIVPRGSTVLEENDRITVIGEPRGIRRLAQRFRSDDILHR